MFVPWQAYKMISRKQAGVCSASREMLTRKCFSLLFFGECTTQGARETQLALVSYTHVRELQACSCWPTWPLLRF